MSEMPVVVVLKIPFEQIIEKFLRNPDAITTDEERNAVDHFKTCEKVRCLKCMDMRIRKFELSNEAKFKKIASCYRKMESLVRHSIKRIKECSDTINRLKALGDRITDDQKQQLNDLQIDIRVFQSNECSAMNLFTSYYEAFHRIYYLPSINKQYIPINKIKFDEEKKCPVCSDEEYEPVSLPCGHIHCQSCIDSILMSDATKICSKCRKGITYANKIFF